MILFSFMTAIYKEKAVEEYLNSVATSANEKNTDDLPFVKLYSTL